jgi:uncharacterized protein YndB with AHSA1/START domain
MKKVLMGIFVLAIILAAATWAVIEFGGITTIVVERRVNAPVEKVWQHWTDRESMKKWWGPKDYTAPVVEHQFQEGGTFLLGMKSPSGEIIYNSGRYQEIVENKRIVAFMYFSDQHGAPIPASSYNVPGRWPAEIQITTEFTEDGAATDIRIQEDGIPMIMVLFAKMGWEQQLDKFEQVVK